MPSPKRVGWAQLRVGVMAIAAMVILGVLIFLMTGEKSLFAREVIIYTYMDDAAALATGAPVRLNGILVGSVERVELSGSTQPNRVVRISMSVPREKLVDIPVDSIAAISAENVLGTKYINIRMGRSPNKLEPGGELRSLDTREFEQVVQASYNVVAALQGILKRVDAIVSQVEAGKGTIGKFLVDEEFYNRLVAAVTEMQKITAAVGSGKGTIGRLVNDEALYNDLRASVQRLDSIMQDVQQGQGTAGKLLRDPALYNETRATIAEFRRTIEDLNAGKGTAGKFLKDDALYRRADRLLARIEETVIQINSGQGTLGQLVANPQLYESMRGLTTDLQALVRDIRREPRKYLHIKLGLF